MRKYGAAFIQVVIIFIVTAGLAQTQTPPPVTITVTDQSGAAVPNASITLTKANETKTFTADANGAAQVFELSTGQWTLSAKGEGFAVRERPLIYQGVSQSITISLDVLPVKQSLLVEAPTEIPSAVQLNASAAGGSYLDVPVRNLPYNFSVINQEYVRERGITNFLDALELVSGVTTWADTGYIPAVDIRGQSTTDAGIYFATEGIVQNSVPQASRNMDTCFIDSIEVLKGPSSFSYGSGTSGASINTRMKAPKREFGVDTLASYGSYGQSRVCLGVTGPLGKNLAGRIDLSFSHGGTNIQRSESTYRGVNIGLIWTPLKRVTIAAKGIYLQDHVSPYFSTPLLNRRVDPNVNYIEVAANTFLDPRARTLNYNISDPRNESMNHVGTLTSEVDLSRGWRLQHKLYGTVLHLDSINTESISFNQTTLLATPSSPFFNFKRDWLVGNNVNLRNTFHFWNDRSISFTIGGTVERNNQGRFSADSAYGPAIATPAPTMSYLNPIAYQPLQEHFIRSRKVDTDYDTGYFEAAFQPLPKLTFSGGARLDHITNSVLTLTSNARNTVSFHPVTGRYAATYELRPTVTLYLGWSKAIQPASTTNNNTGATALVGISATQAQFSTQPSRSWEGGVKASTWRERLQGTLSYFQMRKYNILTQELVDNTIVVERAGRIKSEGIDTSFMVTPVRMFSLQGDFVWNNGRYLVFKTVANNVEIDRSGNRLPRVPAVQWQVTPIVRVGPVTGNISFRTRGASWSDNNNTQRLPPLTVLNSNISINMAKGTRLTFSGRNLTDQLVLNRGGIVSGATTGRIGLPRNYSVQISHAF